MKVLIRAREELESQRALAGEELGASGSSASAETRGYYAGVIAALDWLLGRSSFSPVTSTSSSQPTPSAIAAERDAAEDVVCGRRPGGSQPRSWYSSVSQVLGWVLSDGTSRPLDPPEGELRARSAIAREAAILGARRGAPDTSPRDRECIDGALAALAWLTGDADAPMTGALRRPGGPSAVDVDDEAEVSHQRRFADKADQGPEWNFVYGVDRALDWALDDANRPVL